MPVLSRCRSHAPSIRRRLLGVVSQVLNTMDDLDHSVDAVQDSYRSDFTAMSDTSVDPAQARPPTTAWPPRRRRLRRPAATTHGFDGVAPQRTFTLSHAQTPPATKPRASVATAAASPKDDSYGDGSFERTVEWDESISGMCVGRTALRSPRCCRCYSCCGTGRSP